MISVCMATFNGEKYIHKQINSILAQIGTNDEIIIVDDKSTDKTVNIIKELQDDRIKLFNNAINIGVVKSFEKSILHSKGEIIFLSDQDDFWLSNKFLIMTELIQKNDYLLVISNMLETKKQSEFQIIKSFKMPISNYFYNLYNIFFAKSLYFGSLMCFKSILLKYIIPFPNFVLAHDIHIAIMANSRGKICHLDKVLLLRTNTGNNLTYKKRSITKKILFKISIFKSILFSFKYYKS